MTDKHDIELHSNINDYITLAMKGMLGMVPFVGSLLAEIIGTIIPNQRLDRVTQFAVILDERISQLELDQEYIRSQLDNEYFTDLIEEGMRQAARAISDERKEYIATLIANSLNSDDISYEESKHLLKILGELNDIEIIWLLFYACSFMGGDEEFRSKHQDILAPIPVVMSSPQDIEDDQTIQRSYKEHLARLGLVEPQYAADRKTGQLKVKESVGKATLSISGYKITQMGKLLLREIGIFPENCL